MSELFDNWIDDLRERVVEDEYGYEPGEFTVYPSEWRLLFDEGLTPEAAFRRALDAHAEARRQEDADRQAKWARIQREDAQAIQRHKANEAKA